MKEPHPKEMDSFRWDEIYRYLHRSLRLAAKLDFDPQPALMYAN